MRRWISNNEPIIVALCILCAVGIGMLQTALYWVQTPDDRVFPFVHNFVNDYYYYLHLMRQGFEGQWGVTSWLTPEVFPPRFLNTTFLMLGFLGKIFPFGHMTLPLWYTLGRIGGGIALLALVYVLIRLVFPQSLGKRIAVFLMVLFSTAFWGVSSGFPTVPRLIHEWTELDPLFRLSYIPSHLWSKVFFLGTILALVHVYKREKIGIWIGIGVIGVICMGFSSPVIIATAGVVYAGMFFWGVIKTRSISTILHTPWILFSFVLGLVSLVVALYHRSVQQDVFPWTSYLVWETVKYPIGFWEYAASFGPALPLAIFGFFVGRKRFPFFAVLFALWGITGFLGLFVFTKILPLSNIRFLEGYQYIPVTILAAWALGWIGKRKSVFWILTAIFFLYGSIGMGASLAEHIGYIRANTTNPQVYVPKSWMEVFSYLEKQSEKGTVLAPYELSTMIPALTGKRSVAGHPMMTVEDAAKSDQIGRFFSFATQAERKTIIDRYGVVWIVAHTGGSFTDSDAKILGFGRVFANKALVVYTRGEK